MVWRQMGIPQGHGDVFVSQEFLHSGQSDPSHHKMRGMRKSSYKISALLFSSLLLIGIGCD